MECHEEEGSLRIRRNQDDGLKRPPNFFYSDPEWIAKQLAFTTKRKEVKIYDLIRNIKNEFDKGQTNKQMAEIAYFIKQLGNMITPDPRLCDLLDMDLLKLLLLFLKDDEYPDLQAHTATILKPLVIYSCNDEDVVVVIRSCTPIVVNLIRSKDSMVQVEALWLLRNLVFAISKFSIKDSLVKEALPVITYLIMKDSIGYGVLCAACASLSVFCEVIPKFSLEKLKLVVPALIKLIESDELTPLTSGCRGLALLCDGREEMVVEDEDLDCLIERLVILMNSEERPMVISALNAMRSIVRWGTDAVIETIIKEDGALLILSVLLDEDDMYIVKQTCWILSNITARKEKHIRALIDGDLIGPLVNIVQNCKLPDVGEMAVWALSNAMSGVSLDQIECLRNSCSKVSWPRLLLSILHCNLCILVTLEGLVNIKVAKVTLDGRPIDGVELHSIFKKIVHDGELIQNPSVHDAQTSASGTMEYGRLLFESEVSGHKLQDEISASPVLAPKQKDAPKEEPVDKSPLKPISSAPARGASSTSKSAKRKRKMSTDDAKTKQ